MRCPLKEDNDNFAETKRAKEIVTCFFKKYAWNQSDVLLNQCYTYATGKVAEPPKRRSGWVEVEYEF